MSRVPGALCKFAGCSKPAKIYGDYCNTHGFQYNAYGRPGGRPVTAAERRRYRDWIARVLSTREDSKPVQAALKILELNFTEGVHYRWHEGRRKVALTLLSRNVSYS